MTAYGSPSPYERGEAGQVLPIALHHLSPSFVSIVGIGAVAAAVMSSTDSALLSAASIFTSNIYKNILRTKAAETELQWVIRITVVVVGLLGTSLSFLSNSVMMFWILGSSITYTIMFPQLVCVLFCDVSNACGCVMGILTAALIKVLSGEPALGLPPLFYYPGCPVVDGTYVQCAPVQTISMLCGFISTVIFSSIAHYSGKTFSLNNGMLVKSKHVKHQRTELQHLGLDSTNVNNDMI